MQPIRVKTVQESDLRMLGNLARNIQRVLPVTQADIDAAAALGEGWVVWKVIEVSDPIDNLRGGTQLVIKQNSITPGQNVRRVLIVSGPGGETVVIGPGPSPLLLPDAIADSLTYVKAFGGTEQRNIPQPYTQVNYVTNTAPTAVNTGIMIDFAKNYEFEVEARATTSSWYILQSRETSSSNITGISGSTAGNTITLVVGNVTACTSAITRTVGNKLYVKATLNNGVATLYVKDETAGTEDTQTGSYGASQPNPPTPVYLLGNAGGNYAQINSDIYMARIKENDTVVMDYVPARQVATAGFYDTVSGTFKTAETPANLSADGNTVPTPDTPMDIVSNNGVLKYGQYGKNLFDGAIELGSINPADGSLVVSTTRTRSANFIPVQPNTTYTFTRENTDGIRWIIGYDKNKNGITDGLSTQPAAIINISAGVMSRTFTTTPTTHYIKWYNTSDAGLNEKVQIELGSTATTYEPYHFGLHTDGTVETIGMIAGNLVDSDIVGSNINSAGKIVSSSKIIHTAPVAPGETYTCDAVGTIAYFTEKPVMGSVSYDSSRITTSTPTFTVPNDPTIKYVAFSNDTATSYCVQGSVLYSGGTATAEMLLKVGDYQDVQSIIDGVVTRNVGVLVLDGTESWSYNAQWLRFQTNLPTMPVSIARRLPFISTHYQVTYSADTNPGYVYNGANRQLMISDTHTSVEDWTQWLADQYAAGTPVIILYPLDEPTTESVAGQTLQVTDGDNVLEITQASLNNLELEAEYEKVN